MMSTLSLFSPLFLAAPPKGNHLPIQEQLFLALPWAPAIYGR